MKKLQILMVLIILTNSAQALPLSPRIIIPPEGTEELIENATDLNFISPDEIFDEISIGFNESPVREVTIFSLVAPCDSQKIDEGSATELARCIGSFLNPALPDPFVLLSPLDRISEINPFQDEKITIKNPITSAATIITNIIFVPFTAIQILIDFIWVIVVYVISFIIKFTWVYIVYVSTMYQTVMIIFNKRPAENSQELTIYISLALMGIAYLITFGGYLT